MKYFRILIFLVVAESLCSANAIQNKYEDKKSLIGCTIIQSTKCTKDEDCIKLCGSQFICDIDDKICLMFNKK